MLERVGERLLHDAEDGQLRSGGKLAHVAFDRDRNGQPGRAHLADEHVDLLQTRLRHEPALALAVPQHAEQAAHLAERLPPGHGDRLHGGDRLLGGILSGKRGAVGQRDHHAEVVRDDVVHLAGDARPLRGGRALLQRGLVGVALAHARAEAGGGDGEAGEPDERLERIVGAPARRGEHGAQPQHGRGQNCPAARLVGGDGVEPDQQRSIREHLDVGDPLRTGDDGECSEDPHGGAPPPDQRHRQRNAEQHERNRMGLLGQGVRHRDQEDPEREREVSRGLVPPGVRDRALDEVCVHSLINLRAPSRVHNGRTADLCGSLTSTGGRTASSAGLT